MIVLNGLHLKKMKKYKKMAKKSKYICKNCGRTAKKKKYLCEPVKFKPSKWKG